MKSLCYYQELRRRRCPGAARLNAGAAANEEDE
jgi:hypothetical protein